MKTDEELWLLENSAKISYLDISGILTSGYPITSSLSYAIFLIILNSTFLYKKNSIPKLANDESKFCTKNSLQDRCWYTQQIISIPDKNQSYEEFYADIQGNFEKAYKYSNQTHNFIFQQENEFETLSVKRKVSGDENKHVLHFSGNAQDSMSVFLAADLIEKDRSANFTLWNYPGVAASSGNSSVKEVVAAGVKQVKAILATGVKAEDLFLDGYSFGGAVAIKVAEQLYKENIFVQLNLDRTFASTSMFVPAQIREIGLYNPFVSSIVTCGVLGLTLGISFAQLSKALSLSMKFAFTAFGMSSVGEALDYGVDKLGSLIGGIIAAIGLISLAVIGACIGVVLSVQCLVTDKPWHLPMDFTFKIVLNLANCEMDSYKSLVNALDILKREGQDNEINVITSTADEVIPYYASLQRAFMGDAFNSNDDDYVEKEPVILFHQYSGKEHGDFINPDDDPDMTQSYRK